MSFQLKSRSIAKRPMGWALQGIFLNAIQAVKAENASYKEGE
ncbi:hypothetical protein [Endozoicomonas sp. OPT23]|nr:hypothetical protein [Endozoicomonas sp. OPT23]